MIKRLIFDVDNTLIPWEDKYWNTLNETLIYFEIEPKEELVNKLIEAVDNYELEYNTYNLITMKNIMEKYAGIKLPNNFVYKWTINLRKCTPDKFDDKLIDTLEYLKSKYDLVVLTNWFTTQQAARLKRYGILKYFVKVYGTDNMLNKPNKETFIQACMPYKPEECIFIGDSYNVDIKGSINAGLKAIYLTNKNEKKDNCIVINSIYELKDLL